MKIVIMGCGRVGSGLAVTLDRAGHDVTVIDTARESFRRLGDEFRGTLVLGTGIDERVLAKSGVEEADAFVATTEGDNRNLMATQVARNVFHVPVVIARTYDIGRSELFRKLGVQTFCPTLLGVEILEKMISEIR